MTSLLLSSPHHSCIRFPHRLFVCAVQPPHKTSLLEQLTNVEVWRIVRLLCFVCFLGAVGGGVWTSTSASDHVYLMWDLGSSWNHARVALIQFFYLFLLLGNFIPVSLYVSMSSVKFCQSFFMRQVGNLCLCLCGFFLYFFSCIREVRLWM